MEFNKDLAIALIGYFLAVFFSGYGLIYGVVLYLLNRNKEILYEHSRNIIAISLGLIIIRVAVSLLSSLF